MVMVAPVRGMKTCSLCGESKPVDDFHRRRHYSRDGHRAACKTCTAEERRKRRSEKSSAALPEERQKQRVRYQTRQLILSGELTPQRCQVCGGRDVQAHHPSYEGPEAVRTVAAALG